jgi:uncharacterized membrane protein YbhN (UPF0104 family)
LEKVNKKGIFKLFVKIVLTVLALYVVARKIDVRETGNILLHSNPGWLFLAMIFFNLSKAISSFRYRRFLYAIDVALDKLFNLKLYYVGMFYNLFLPGGIGGDGYKVYLLNKSYDGPLKKLIGASLLDRISGLVSLSFLALVLMLFIDLDFLFANIDYLVIGVLVAIFPAYYLINKFFFKSFLPVFYESAIFSIGVQLAQLICAYFILLSLDVSGNYVEYMGLFLVSSIVAVLPFTIGGIGARELVFIFAAEYLLIDRNTAVAFSLIFFIITAVSSFAGILFNVDNKN